MAKKRIVVISLGGSLIVPEKINAEFLEKFKKVLLKNTRRYKFIVVCGGGNIARTYIKGLEQEKTRKKQYFQCLLGISITRTNARFMTYFFGRDANQGMPHDMKDIENLLKRNDVVFCGALRYGENETSDGTAAKLAHHFCTDFINLTNVKGLYEKNPKKFRNAKFIPEISHKDFYKMVKKVEYEPGQHFILDQKAAKIIKKHKIVTFILGPELKNIDNLLNGKHFVGTIIG